MYRKIDMLKALQLNLFHDLCQQFNYYSTLSCAALTSMLQIASGRGDFTGFTVKQDMHTVNSKNILKKENDPGDYFDSFTVEKKIPDLTCWCLFTLTHGLDGSCTSCVSELQRVNKHFSPSLSSSQCQLQPRVRIKPL